MKTEFLGKTVSGPFTIPSGIVSTAPSIIQRIFDDLPEIGVITTKSVGQSRAQVIVSLSTASMPRLLCQRGWTHQPGAEEARKGFESLTIPEDRFLLVSIFGGSIEEFVEVAKILAPVADGLELNLSCPHAQGYGMAMGQDPEMVKAIVSAVKAAVDVPVIPKLTPNVDRIEDIGLAALEAGADGLCAINTVGPGYTESHGHPYSVMAWAACPVAAFYPQPSSAFVHSKRLLTSPSSAVAVYRLPMIAAQQSAPVHPSLGLVPP